MSYYNPSYTPNENIIRGLRKEFVCFTKKIHSRLLVHTFRLGQTERNFIWSKWSSLAFAKAITRGFYFYVSGYYLFCDEEKYKNVCCRVAERGTTLDLEFWGWIWGAAWGTLPDLLWLQYKAQNKNLPLNLWFFWHLKILILIYIL